MAQQASQAASKSLVETLASPAATLAAALCAAIASVIATMRTAKTAQLARDNSTREIQLRSDLDSLNARFLREDERAFALRNKQVDPFIDALLEVIRRGAIVKIAVEKLSSLSYSPSMRSLLLFDMDEVQKWISAGTTLSRLRASVILGVDEQIISEFMEITNRTIYQQLRVVNFVLEKVPDETTKEEFDKRYAEYATTIGNLLTLLRRYVRGDKATSTIASAQISDWLNSANPLHNRFGLPDIHPWWIAFWRTTDTRDDQFRSDLEALEQHLATAVGVLAIDSNVRDAIDDPATPVTLQLTFADWDSLDAYLATLPAIKAQTKSLWVGNRGAETRWAKDRPARPPTG